MNKLSSAKRVQILKTLVEGNGVRSTARLAGVSKNTILKLVVDAGRASARYQDTNLRNLKLKRIQCDEIWGFCLYKDKNVPLELRGNHKFGDAWTWTALCPDTKLIPCWLVGKRSAEYARVFMKDLASRLLTRVQLTTDGYKPYPDAVFEAFGKHIDYANIVKKIGSIEEGNGKKGALITSTQRDIRIGTPDLKHISTSLVERQNLTMRMGIKRLSRKTNAYSKKHENLCHAIALHFMYYNFIRRHSSINTTPAIAAGVINSELSFENVLEMIL